jgi:hypothetical protein
VPLAWTKCGQKLLILWQVDIGFDDGVEQQVIKGTLFFDPLEVNHSNNHGFRNSLGNWHLLRGLCPFFSLSSLNHDLTLPTLNSQPQISQAIDRVVILQKYYLDDLVHRCRQRPLIVSGELIPAHFSCTPDSIRPDLRAPKPDIRVMNRDIIEMSSTLELFSYLDPADIFPDKFYSLTEPVIRSVLDNDVTAEFPFDLSEDEASVIRHFKTSSLILGRSGTGKTTCLVFKLVGKYLARKAVAGARPVRQVGCLNIVITYGF